MKSSSVDIFRSRFDLDCPIVRCGYDKKPGLINFEVKDESDEGKHGSVLYQIWRPLVVNEEVDLFSLSSLASLRRIRMIPVTARILLIHYHGGDFCICSFDKNLRCTHHKSFHKYVVRKKQGGKQSRRKKQGTAGSQMRMLNEKLLVEGIENLFKEDFWIEKIKNAAFIGIICPGRANRTFITHLVEGCMQPNRSSDVLRNLPFQYGKASFTNTKDAFQKLVRVTQWNSNEKSDYDRFFNFRKKKSRKNSKTRKKKSKKKKKIKNPKKEKLGKKRKSKDLGLDEVLFSPLSEYLSPVISPVLSSASSFVSSVGSMVSPILSPIISPISALFMGSDESGKGKQEENDVFLQAIKDLDVQEEDQSYELEEESEEEGEDVFRSVDVEEEGEDIVELISKCSDNSEFEIVEEGEGEGEEEELEEEGEEEDVKLQTGGRSKTFENTVALFTLFLVVVTIAVLIKKNNM